VEEVGGQDVPPYLYIPVHKTMERGGFSGEAGNMTSVMEPL
jgi:hypothetical protein